MATRPDPDPDSTAGLEPGGGVIPGDTPPIESATSGLSSPQPQPKRAIPMVFIIAIVLFVLFVLAFLVGRIVDLI